jgi:hypothetical protein
MTSAMAKMYGLVPDLRGHGICRTVQTPVNGVHQQWDSMHSVRYSTMCILLTDCCYNPSVPPDSLSNYRRRSTKANCGGKTARASQAPQPQLRPALSCSPCTACPVDGNECSSTDYQRCSANSRMCQRPMHSLVEPAACSPRFKLFARRWWSNAAASHDHRAKHPVHQEKQNLRGIQRWHRLAGP